MAETKKPDNKKKRKNEAIQSQAQNPELRNYLVKKIKIEETKKTEDEQQKLNIPTIKVTTNGKKKIRLYVNECEQVLKDKKIVRLLAVDKAISRLVTVVEIVKQNIFKSSGAQLTQQNNIFNTFSQDQKLRLPSLQITLQQQQSDTQQSVNDNSNEANTLSGNNNKNNQDASNKDEDATIIENQ